MELDSVADQLFEGVMAPLVLGGPVRPAHAIGARVAWALGDKRQPSDAGLAVRVRAARLRRARMLAAVDSVPEPTAVDWALAAAFHDLLQAANPTFATLLRQRAANRILDVAATAIERAPPPATLGETLARHTWFARYAEVKRVDTTVSWWTGSRQFLGVPAPARLQAWPELRRVRVVRAQHAILELAPLAVDRDLLSLAVAGLLARTPLTDIATCTREGPPFQWTGRTLALLGAPAGRALAARALDRLPSLQVDVALGAATRTILASNARTIAAPVVALLADRVVGSLLAAREPSSPTPLPPDALFARSVGAAAARAAIEAEPRGWPAADRDRLLTALEALTTAA